MKDKKKVIALSGAILAIAATIGIGTWIGSSKNENDTVVSKTGNSEEVSPGYKINEDGTIDYYYTDEDILTIQENMNIFKYMGMKKIETFRVYDEEYNVISFETISNVITEIDLNNKVDFTVDGQTWEGVGDVNDLPKEDFVKTFGFDYKKYNNVFDVMTALLDANGITINMEDSIKDDSYLDEYGQIYYKLNNDAGIIENLLNGVEYDEIVYSDVHYNTNSDEYGGDPYVEFISSSVVYKKDNKYYQKNVVYSMHIFNYDVSVWADSIYGDEDNDCTCGPDTDCNTGEDNGIDCEGDGDC